MAGSTGAAEASWREVYPDLNQVSDRIRLDQLEFSEVMVIHRMHIKMSELDLGHLEGAEKVERLYVFADVVELDVVPHGSSSDGDVVVRLPGSKSVTFVCRVWHINYALVQMSSNVRISRSVVLELRHMRWHFNAITGRMHLLDPQTLQDSMELCFCVHTEVVQIAYYPDVTFPESNDSPSFLRFLRLVIEPDQLRFTTQTEGPLWALRGSLEYFMSPDNNGLLNEVSSQPAGTTFVLNILPDNLDVQLFANRPSSGTTLTRDPNSILPAFSVYKQKAGELLSDPNILPAMQTSMLIGELVEVGHPPSATTEVVRKHVEWLNHLLLQVIEAKQGENAEDYVELSFRAQYVIKKVGRIQRLVVPQLQYSAYSNLINRLAQVAESYDQALRQFRLFIQQNKILGGFLLEQNRAFAEKEQDMDVFYSELIAQRQIELDNTLQKMKHLGAQMETQTADMEQAQADMEAGIREFQNRQVARGLFAVLGAIAAVGLTLLTGGAAAPLAISAARSAVSVAGAVAQGLQRVLDVLEGLRVVMEVVELISDLISSLQELGQPVDLPEMAEMPTEADWLIFVNEVEGVAEQMPTEVSEVVAWKTKCKNVAVLGREMTTLAAYISQLQYDINMQHMLQRIARKQADRLSAIELPDLRNYGELVTQMDMRTTRLLVALIKVVNIQNAALMYQYLSEPTPVYAWPVNMDSVWRMLVQHEQFAIQGLMRLGPAFDIVRTYEVKGIPVSLLLDGDDYEFEIPAQNHVTFPLSLSRVRIHHLEMKFVQGSGAAGHDQLHMPVTDTGSIYVLLQGSRNFHDRSEGSILHYEAATSLDYHFAYRLDTGETTVTNLPSAEFLTTFMRMTPFTNWRLRVSASAEENKGLAFPTATSADATSHIAITFFISAIRQIAL